MQVEGCFASDCRVSVDLAHGVSDGQRLSLTNPTLLMAMIIM